MRSFCSLQGTTFFFAIILLELRLSEYSKGDDNPYSKHVWIYYDGKLAPIMETLVNRTQVILSREWNVHFLTATKLYQFLDVSTFPDTYQLFTPQAQSDLIRLRLLRRYGGWWIDSSTIVNSASYLDSIRTELILNNASLFGFCFIQCPRLLIESGVLYAPRNSKVIQSWDDEYTYALTVGRENYIYKRFREGVDLPSQLFLSYPVVNPYFTVYATERVALTRIIPRRTVILTLEANKTIYKLLEDCEWKVKCTVNALRSEIDHPRYYLTKLWSWWRSQAWPGSQARSKRTNREPSFQLKGLPLTSGMKMKWFLWLGYQFSILNTYFLSLVIESKQRRKDKHYFHAYRD